MSDCKTCRENNYSLYKGVLECCGCKGVLPKEPIKKIVSKYITKNPLKIRALDLYFKEISKHLGRPTSILDLGVGPGIHLQILSPCITIGTKIVGVDYNKDCLKYAKKEFPYATYILKDLEEFKTRKKYDLVLCLEVLEHLRGPEKLLEKVSIMGKRAIISVPDKTRFRLASMLSGKNLSRLGNDPYHLNEWNFKEFKALLEKYFDYVLVERSGVWLIANLSN